jgi:hypothetical protein
LDKYSVGYYDTKINAWIAEEGVFKVLVGASSADIRYALLSLLAHLLFMSAVLRVKC